MRGTGAGLVGRGERHPLKPLRCRCTAISPLRGPNPLPVPRSRVLADPCIYLYISFVHFHVWRRSGRVFTLRPKRYSVRVTAAKAAERLEPDPTRRMVRGVPALGAEPTYAAGAVHCNAAHG